VRQPFGVTVVDRNDPDLALNARESTSPTGIRNAIEIGEGAVHALLRVRREQVCRRLPG
jgi:hypothetical protein